MCFRERFAKSMASGDFFGLTKEEKSNLSPEVHSVAWMPLAEVVWFSMTSKSNPPLFINDFQQREFEELGTASTQYFSSIKLTCLPHRPSHACVARRHLAAGSHVSNNGITPGAGAAAG
jgi:hypothetical protein